MFDPGTIYSTSTPPRIAPTLTKLAQQTRAGLRPLLQRFSKSAINHASVPAKAICKLAFRNSSVQDLVSERYYVLEKEYDAGSVIDVLRDEKLKERLLKMMMRQTNLNVD